MDYIRRELGVEAKQYIIDKLQDGRIYSQRILPRLKLRFGDVFTYLPQELTGDELLSFVEGARGIAQSRTVQHVIDYIDTYLVATKDRNSLVLFENATCSRGDQSLSNCESNLAFHGRHVYHFLFGREATPDSIDLHLSNAASAWQDIAFLTTLPRGMSVQPNEEIDDDLLAALVERTEVIISDAYDLDGYLFWELRGPM